MNWSPALVFLTLLSPAFAYSQQTLEPEFLHIRNTPAQEWSHFPVEANSSDLRINFDLENPQSIQLLTLRQEETRQAWEVRINDQKLGTLPRDHNHLEHGIQIPVGLLKKAGNILEIATKSDQPDDIRLGDIALHDSLEVLVDEERANSLFLQRGYRRALPPMSAEVTLKATDKETGKPLPCRFTVIDAETGALAFIGAESDDRIAVREGVVYTLDGKATIKLAGNSDHPRRYKIFCGRGFEYSVDQIEVTIHSETDLTKEFSISHEVPTPGLVACDPHLHTFQFDRHGDCNLVERLISIAGEGVELPVSSGHDKHLDFTQEATRIGADNWFTPVLGCEVTTHIGHFNSFPIESEAKPAEHKLRPWPQIFQNIYATPGVRVCIINHGRDVHRGFRPFGPENFDLKSGTFQRGWKLEANGMELINSGAQQTDPMELVHDWFALLRSGHRIAGVGTSDSHTVNFAIPGQGRTYLETNDHTPGSIDIDEAVDSLVEGRSWVSFGLLTQFDLDREKKEVTARVLGPSWTTSDRIRIFRNGEEIRSLKIPADSGGAAGEKFSETFSLAELEVNYGDFLCAVATGPGISEGWWPIMPPYQPDSPNFTPFVIGISPAVWVD